LVLEKTALSTFPCELEGLCNITYMSIRNIGLSRIDFDFRHLPRLRELHISDNDLTFVSDTFQDCLELRSFHISSKTVGFAMPASLDMR
jgi:Leucine-rich repeat (LRR) protein